MKKNTQSSTNGSDSKSKSELDKVTPEDLKTLPPVPKEEEAKSSTAEPSTAELYKMLDEPLPMNHEMEILAKLPIFKGLENVIIDTTHICAVDGWTGELYFRGYSIYDLVEKSTFEEVTFLLIFGRLPSLYELEMFREQLIKERDIPDRIVMILQSFPRETTRIELLRTAISALSLYDPDDYTYNEQANIRKGIRIIAKIPTILAFSHRIKGNMPLIPPSKTLSHAGNFYYMMTGQEPTPQIESAFDKLLICQAEHDVNASTLAARVTVSTLSDIYSAVVSAIGALRGPLHGGANERVINYLLYEIKKVENTLPWLEEKMAKKEKIMGFGHRVYKTWDPRTKVLKQYCEKYFAHWAEEHPDHSHENLLEMQKIIEEYMITKKKLYPNVDFYSASLLHALGVPTQLYTPLFAASRSAGWVAHCLEQLRNNKLMRPRMRYLGEINTKYVPIEERNFELKQ
jgi:citrate synthase